jgi:hypothetical protein
MKTDERGYFDSLSERVLGAVIEVSKTLAPDSEKCTSERCSEKLAFAASVEEVLVVELKWWKRLNDEHTAQCLNYLRASATAVCLLINSRTES